MNLQDIQKQYLGEWTGTNMLRLSWLNPSEFHSAGQLSVAALGRDKFLTFRYTWSHENTAHEGFLLLAYDAKQAVAAASWVDSWHQSAGILNCLGTIDATGIIDVRGSYPAPPDPDWGWRIVITANEADTLQITMYNVTPAGEEDLAVQTTYTRNR